MIENLGILEEIRCFFYNIFFLPFYCFILFSFHYLMSFFLLLLSSFFLFLIFIHSSSFSFLLELARSLSLSLFVSFEELKKVIGGMHSWREIIERSTFGIWIEASSCM